MATIVDSKSQAASFGNNPFKHRTDLSPRTFVGRECELSVIMQRLTNRESTSVCGEEGIGKSSLLKRVCHPGIVEEWELHRSHIFLLLDCLQFVSWSPSEFWGKTFELLSEQDLGVGSKEHIHKILSRRSFEAQDINGVIDTLASDGQTLVLLLDSFDHVLSNMELRDPPFLNLMRSFLVRPSRGLALVVTTVEPLDNLCRRIQFIVSPFDNVFMLVSLTPLSPDDVNRLVDSRLAGTSITFTPSQRIELYKMSQGNPGKLVSACYDLFEQYAIVRE